MCLLTSMNHEWNIQRIPRRKKLPRVGPVYMKVGGTGEGEVPHLGGAKVRQNTGQQPLQALFRRFPLQNHQDADEIDSAGQNSSV